MKNQTTADGLHSRFRAKRHFALALATSFIAYPGLVGAEDGVRELKEPAEMQKVAPVRAVGIRLSPAAPIDLNQPTPTKTLPPIIKAGAINSKPDPKPSAAEAVNASPAELFAKSPSVSNALTSPPPRPLSMTNVAPSAPIASSSNNPASPIPASPIPASPIPASPVAASPVAASPVAASPVADGPVAESEGATNPTTKRPERILPKSKVAGPNKDSVRSPLVKAQAPIDMFLGSSEGIRTASAPSASHQQPMVAGIVATESAIVTSETSNATVNPTPVAAGNATSVESSISTLELEQAVNVDVESHRTQEVAIDFAIRSVIVRDEKVCRAISHGDGISIVGLSLGESIVEIKPVEDRPSHYLRVKVASSWQRSSGTADLDQLVHAIQALNPNGILSVRALEDGSIIVQGKVENKETAKRIMELTRKLILVPVVDKLEIR